MRTKVKAASLEMALTRLLEALERELIESTDEEIMEAAQELGMNPQMKGSAAFAGIKFPARPQLSDFFELEACRIARVAAERISDASPARAKRKARQPRRREISRQGKDRGDK